ncbi:MAG: M50 family metallopeptidase [Bacteroidota bacterium]
MEPFLSLLAALVIIKLIYLLGKILFYRLFKAHDQKVQVGYSPVLFTIKRSDFQLDFGFVIPLPFLLKVYAIEEGEKHPVGYAWEFYEVSWWKRLVATFGGNILLFVTGIVIFIVLALVVPEQFYSRKQVMDVGIYPGSLAKEIGFLPKDKILTVNGEVYERFTDLISPEVLLGENSYYEVQRGSDKVVVRIPYDFLDAFVERRDQFIELNTPFEVGNVTEWSAAEAGGMKAGDKILKLDTVEIYSFPQFQWLLQHRAGESVQLTLRRDNQLVEGVFEVGEDGLLGFAVRSLMVPVVRYPGFGEAVVKGTSRAFDVIRVNLKALRKIFVGEPSDTRTIGGPIGLARVFGRFQWIRFWAITGMLIMVTGFFDLFPFPLATGLQSIPLLAEGVLRKKMGLNAFRNIRRWSFGLVILLMVFALLSDVSRMV